MQVIKEYKRRYTWITILTTILLLTFLYLHSIHTGVSEEIEFALILIGLLLIVVKYIFVYRPMEKRFFYAFDLIEKEHAKVTNLQNNLKEINDRYDLALNTIKFGVWDWNVATNSLYWSQQLKDMLGIKPEDFNNSLTDFTARVHPDDLERVMEMAAQHFDHRGDFECSYRVLHSDGSYVWVFARGQATWDSTDTPIRMAGSMENITEAKIEEQQARIFTSGIEAANISIAIIDMQKKGRTFVYVSPAMAHMTGFSLEKLRQGNLNMFIGPDTEMGDLDKIDTAIKAAKPLTIELLCYRSTGESFRNKITLAPVFDENHKLQAFITIHTDMTESILRERRETNRQRMESLGTLSGNVAHEINNLLVPMLLAQDIIAPHIKPDADPYVFEHLDQITQYSEQAGAIVKGILTFTRKESEQGIIIPAYTILMDTLHFVESLVRSDVKLITDIDANLIKINVNVNKTEFRQVLTNFISNAGYALQGNANGEIEITGRQVKLTTKQRNELDIDKSDMVCITIRDNGSGIPDDVIDRIFEPLFTTKPIGEGTGLGLSVVHGIIRNLGGAITVQSTPNIGTLFSLYIPVYYADDDLAHYSDLLDELNVV